MQRTGVITFKGNGLTLVGTPVAVGDKAPDFTVLDQGLGAVRLADFAGKRKVISVTPSLDTPVCDAQLRRFNTAAAALGDHVAVLNISMDLPFAVGRFCSTAGIDRVVSASDHRDASFGLGYGVLIEELRLLTRAVFVIDEDDVVRYAEIVPEVTSAPNFDAALAAAKK
jgi:thiol peroxidase